MKKVTLSMLQAFKAKGVKLDDEEKEMLETIEAAVNDALTKMQEGSITKDDVDEQVGSALKEARVNAKSIVIAGTAKKGEDGETEGEDLTLDQYLRERAKEIADLRKAQGEAGAQPRTYQDALREACKDLSERAKKHKAATNGSQVQFSVEATIKAPAMMSTTNTSSNVGSIPVGFQYNEGPANPDTRLGITITDLVDNGSTSLPAIPYADKTPTQGTMTIVAEGALKPLLSFAIERRFSQAVKVAGRMKITEEALDDIPGMQSSINGELTYAHGQAVEDVIFDHVNSFAPAFVAGALAASTNAPSNYDVLRAAQYSIKIVSKGRFIPNAAVVHSADAYAMGATKDDVWNYVLPPFVLPDGTKVAGMTIVETQDDIHVPPGTFIVGDFRKIKRRTYKPFSLRVGQGLVTDGLTVASIQSDFECNIYTFIGESRLHVYHYKNDETAFVKDTFVNVKTLIVAP